MALGIANAVTFEAAAVGSWQQRVPRLLRDLVRVLLVAFAAALAYSFIWGREIQGALAALGVTSIVVGLALQEPLGNLFSGLMLLMERPFEIGDSIQVGDVSGTVKEINWRSAHIEALGGMIQVVPNSTLNKETISNFSRPLPVRMEMLELAFSADDPPNKVRRALLEVARTTKGVIQSPKPIAATIGYGNHAVNYRLIWRVAEDDRWSVRNDLITRIWYMTRRHGLTMPYPVNVSIQHTTTAPFKKAAASAAEILARVPHLPRVPVIEPDGVRALAFGKGEVIFDAGQLLDGVYLVVKGGVSMQLVSADEVAEIGTLGPGGFFGEAGMHGTHTADSAGRRPRRHRGAAARSRHRAAAVRGQPDAGPRHRAGARRQAQGAAVSSHRAAAPLITPRCGVVPTPRRQRGAGSRRWRASPSSTRRCSSVSRPSCSAVAMPCAVMAPARLRTTPASSTAPARSRGRR